MGLKLSSSIAIARTVLNDTDPAGYRYPDADLLSYGNGAIRALAQAKPELLYTEGELQCEVGKALQSVSFDDARALVNVVRVKNGNAVWVCDKATLDAYDPNWMTATPAPAIHWMPHGDDPRRFFIYPPAPSGQVLEVVYVRIPPEYAANDDTGLPETITEAVADYIVGMAEARDDEFVVAQRSAQFIQQFAARLGASNNGSA